MLDKAEPRAVPVLPAGPDARAGGPPGCGLVAFDGRIRVTAWHPAVAAWTGVAEDAALGRPLAKLAPWLASDGAAWQAILDGRLPPAPIRLRLAGRDGTQSLLAEWQPLAGRAGRRGGIILLRDVTGHGGALAWPPGERLLQQLGAVAFTCHRLEPGRYAFGALSPGLRTLLSPGASEPAPRDKASSDEAAGEPGAGDLPMTPWLHPADRAAWHDALERSLQERAPVALELRLIIAAGDIRWLRVAAEPAAAASGRATWQAIAIDQTDLRRRETALAASEARLQTFSRATFEGVVLHDQGRILDVNHTLLELTGHRRDALIAADLEALLPREACRPPEAGAIAFTMRRSDGSSFAAEARGKAIARRGRRIGMIAIRDIAVRERAEDRIRYLAHHDALTGLPNRALFMDRLRQAMAQARRDRTVLAILQIDLDGFKDVNDTLGHGAGDDLLRQAARRLTRAVLETDTVARIGGDEFGIILTGLAQPLDAGRIAQRLLGRLAEPVAHQAHPIHTGASIGITVFPEDDVEADQLLRNANIALCRAKANGGHGLSFFVDAMKRQIERRKDLEGELRRALAHEEFVLHYQPQVGLADGRVCGVEALLRWQHPSRGLLAPGDFLAIAEASGLIMPIGLQVLHQACAEARRWLDAGLVFGRLAVNLAPTQFRTGRLVRAVKDVLQASGIAPRHLELEVTEGVFLGRHAEQVATILGRLHQIGIQIALDDFGTGFASLVHLKRFPIGRLKIDRSFVADLGHDQDDAAIVRAVISLGQSLGIEVVAEGVETPAQLAFLRRQGCDVGQGYLFAKPLPAAEVAAFLAGRGDGAINGAPADALPPTTAARPRLLRQH